MEQIPDHSRPTYLYRQLVLVQYLKNKFFDEVRYPQRLDCKYFKGSLCDTKLLWLV